MENTATDFYSTVALVDRTGKQLVFLRAHVTLKFKLDVWWVHPLTGQEHELNQVFVGWEGWSERAAYWVELVDNIKQDETLMHRLASGWTRITYTMGGE